MPTEIVRLLKGIYEGVCDRHRTACAQQGFSLVSSIMDLRPLIKSAHQIEDARDLALRGLLSYQPYIFSDTFAVGAGLSIVAGHLKDPPAVYCPDATASDTDAAFFAREFAKEQQREEFFAANEAMRRFYDGMVDQIAAAVGPLEDMSVLDVGCNTGYFPLAFARRGARQAKGIDRIDYSPTVALLNEICGTSVQFARWNYDGSLTASDQYDLVLSIAVLVHLSEPLRHLAWLGSSARKALMVFTPFHNTPDCSIQFHTENRYYKDADFPHCFDITTVSEQLLRLAFEQMGFSHIIEITAAYDTMAPGWAGKHLGLLGIREGFADVVPTAVVPTAASPTIVVPTKVAPGEVSMQAYERRLKAHIREQVMPLRKQLLGLEGTLEERMSSLERTIEERSNRIASLEASLDERDRRLGARWRRRARRWLDFVARLGIPKN